MNRAVTARNYFILLFLFFFITEINAAAIEISLTGHLGKEQVAEAKKTIKETTDGPLLLEVNSTSGDLEQVLSLAKEIYALRVSKGIKVIVYIQNSAIGPSAIIPFLADQLYSSIFVTWGDIPLGSEEGIPTNILRNTVKSLIPTDHPENALLSLIATAMADPVVQVVDDEGWKIMKGDHPKVISPEWEALVLNHNQLKELGLIEKTLTLEAFRQQFVVDSITAPAIVDEELKGVAKPSVLQQLKEHIVFSEKEPNTIGLIKIDNKKSQISQATWIYVKNALEYYKQKKPAFIILELNTPGGEVFSAQKISDALKEIDTQLDIPVVCFINNWAISAGAMLAYSCRFITVTKDASMGAAEPVIAGEGGQMVTASEKVNSALRTDFANRARFFDRNPDIAEAMVDKDIILVKRFGKIVRLDNEDQIKKSGPYPDVVITNKGKLLTLNTEEMLEYEVADLLLSPAKTALITQSERDKGKWPASKMLLFQNPFFKQIPNATVDLYQMDWKTQFLVLISNPIVSSLLFLGMLLGFYVEINSPGFGFPGSVALLCLFMITLSSFALEVANMLEVVLLLVGIVFIALDLFLIPTFGILGIVGVVFFFIGLFGMMLPGIGSVDFEMDTQTFNAAGEVFVRRLAWLCGTLVVGVILIAMLGRYVMPTFSGFQRFVLIGSEETKEEGYIAGADPKSLPQPGTKGEVMATLRPSGKVMIEDTIYDAITYGEFIEKGTPIVVERLDGSVIVVNREVRE